jgi:hypothetical protein
LDESETFARAGLEIDHDLLQMMMPYSEQRAPDRVRESNEKDI